MPFPTRTATAAALGLFIAIGVAHADGSGDPKAVSSDDGKYADANGNPTFDIKDGKLDYYAFAGYIRYTANCMQCHGPDGLGSTYAPSLVDALKTLSYGDFVGAVAGGKKDVNSAQTLVMPTFGNNKNVMCYIDPIFVYLRGRSDGAIGRGRPQASQPRPAAYTAAENSCMG